MTDKIIEQLREYFKSSKQEFSIGLQNFQGIRGYTTIPLAPLTLVYGQNSAGKSTIHDAQQFIYHFFSGKWGHDEAAQYLDRWANHHRVSKPLTKGYLGDPEDVVLSISSLADNLTFSGWA
ncbi:MAG: AAA family ATPase [Methyloprofundus sp.]|nr:AAA family ATPase [Methyloprofundus sp.]